VGTGALVIGLTLAVLRPWPGRAVADRPRSHDSLGHTVTQPWPAITVRAVPARRTGAERPEAPTTMRLPDGTEVRIRRAGTATDGSLSVPDDIRLAGWWRGSARVGDPFGSTVLAAHVDSFTQGLGPYATLLSARSGQQVIVGSRHLRQTFTIVSLRLLPRETLSRHPGLFSARGPRRLTLVTCAPPYDARRGGYQNLAVVKALPTSDAVRRTTP
jgi:hypothetical protein